MILGIAVYLIIGIRCVVAVKPWRLGALSWGITITFSMGLVLMWPLALVAELVQFVTLLAKGDNE